MTSHHSINLASMTFEQVVTHIKRITNLMAEEEMSRWVKAKKTPIKVISCITPVSPSHHSHR
jgi:hypothetical protein